MDLVHQPQICPGWEWGPLLWTFWPVRNCGGCLRRQAHPEDVTGDACSLCGGTDEVAGDWISCDACSAWVHFSCDTRPGMGAFKDYARAGGEPYICGRCAQAPPAASAGADPGNGAPGAAGAGDAHDSEMEADDV